MRKLLNYRNVHIVSPRNFGNSDRNESFDVEEVAADVLRYMWEHKITSATLGGHGYGGKVALATGCYYSERSTGVVAVDYSPMDMRFHESYRELKGYVNELTHFDVQ
jgi:pimeloyl-ACP methyl ester carboxylesterase